MNHRQAFEQYKDQEAVCCTCGTDLPEDDSLWDWGHVENPRSRGGGEVWPQCVRCNVAQGTQTMEEWDANGDSGAINVSTLRMLVDLRTSVQKSRIRMGNAAAGATRFGKDSAVFAKYAERYRELEAEAARDIKVFLASEMDDQPIYAALLGIKGVGPVMAGRVLADVDIRRAGTVSALWCYAGYAPGRDRSVKGEKRPYNVKLRTALRVLATGFLKAKSPYRAVYDEAKADAVRKHPEWALTKDGKARGPGHYHNHALRVMMKVFLQHLWITWRRLEGLPVSEPYAHGVLGHAHYHRPEDFGWPAISGEKPIL